MVLPASPVISPQRQRMIEDMRMRQFNNLVLGGSFDAASALATAGTME